MVRPELYRESGALWTTIDRLYDMQLNGGFVSALDSLESKLQDTIIVWIPVNHQHSEYYTISKANDAFQVESVDLNFF